MIERVLEPELMLDKEQALQYSLADFEIQHSRYPEDFKKLLPSVDVRGLILDIGCGPADVTLRFAKLFSRARVVGIDGSEEMLKLARERVAKDLYLRDRVRFENITIPLRERRYKADLIIANGMLHHIHNPQDFWRTVLNQSTDGTYIFVTDLLRPESEDKLLKMVNETCSNYHPVHKADYENSLRAAFTERELVAQLTEANLSNSLKVLVPETERVIIYGQINSKNTK